MEEKEIIDNFGPGNNLMILCATTTTAAHLVYKVKASSCNQEDMVKLVGLAMVRA